MTGNSAHNQYRSIFHSTVSVVAVWLCLASFARGQGTPGLPESATTVANGATLQGRVLDPTRAAIMGARITATPAGGSSGPSTLSGQSGEFSLALEPGIYTLRITFAGFQEASQSVNVLPTTGTNCQS